MRARDKTTGTTPIPATSAADRPHAPAATGARAAVGALAFLTRAPVGTRADADLAHAAPLFPAVGALIGAVVGGTATLLAFALPPLVAAGIAVALEVAITGALHLDGLADSADGLAGRDREHALAIMRDHVVGTYGTCALVLNLLVKTAAVAALAGGDAILVVIAAYTVSRAAALPLAAALGPARPGPGVGRLIAGRLSLRVAAAGTLLSAVIATAASGWRAAPTLGCLAVVTAVVGVTARRRLGGVTGDTFGAAIELTATLALVVAAAVDP